MADIYSDSNTSNSDESADEGPSNLIAEAKRLGANLRTPEKAKIARERKLQTNPAGKSRSTRGQSDPKLSSWQRVQEHKNEYLASVDGKLRCDACKETISKKKSTVKKHISSLKHVKAKKTILESKKKDQSVLELLRRNDQAKHPKGETLPHDMCLYRFDLIQSFLTAGIPLSKIDYLRSFLEKYGYIIQCCSRSSLPQCGRSSSPPSRRKLACLQSAGGQIQSMYQSGVAVFSEEV